MTISPLRQFVLAAMLWLPACFALWALWATLIVWPVAGVTDWILPRLLPDAIAGVDLAGPKLEVETRLLTQADASGRVGAMVLEVSPLIYAWCLPLFVGLSLATPLTWRQRLVQLAVGLPLLWLVVSWGATFDVLKLLAFDAGPLGQAAVQVGGWSLDAIALGYQFGYLILPAVTPVALWIVLNRAFLELLVGWNRELEGVDAGLSNAADTAGDPPNNKAED
jgi:hypothetical protein